VGAMCGLG